MAGQTGKNLLVAYKAETTLGVAPTASGATRFRPNPGAGLSLKRATIRSNEIRADLKTSMPRLGSKRVDGSYPADLSVGTFDPLFEAVTRGTWTAANVITQATGTSVTATAGPPGTIVRAAGSWITDGVRVGDVGKLNATGGPAGNNNINLRVVGVTALTLTVAETLTVDATPRTTFTFTVAKKVFQPAVPVARSFTFEEYDADVDLTEQAVGVRCVSMHVTGQPDGMALVEFGFIGLNLVPLVTGTSPFYTSPALTTSIGLTMADAVLRFGGVDVVNLTSFDFTVDLSGSTQPVIGSLTSPDVYTSSASLAGSISATRNDFTNLNRFIGETELEFHALLVEPTAEPKNFISFFLPRIKLTGAETPQGADGAMIESMPFTGGDKEVATGYDDTMVLVSTSAP